MTIDTELSVETGSLMFTVAPASKLGSLSKDDGYGNENVIPKYNLRYCKYFAIIPSCSPFTIRANYPVTGWVRTVLKSKQKMIVSLLYVHVVFNTLNMVISRCYFVEYGREMHGNSCCTCSTSIFLF